MRITVVNGFFLPVPPVAGGATEKSWFRLAAEFAARGHEVVSISRRWPGCADEETAGGLRHLRLPGADHHRSLRRNLLRDLRWSLRVYRRLPPADIVVCNAVTLPVWLGRLKPAAGRVVVMCGRMPKGQYRRYTALARVLAPSGTVRDRILRENPALGDRIRVTGYPIDWSLFHAAARTAAPAVALGYVGRLHEEKGLLLLVEALRRLQAVPGLPPWQFTLGGPADVAAGGSGPAFRARLLQLLAAGLPPDRWRMVDPEFNEPALAARYRALDVFCYPSLAAQGETFGVAVAEAMAAGAVPVVSGLDCFREFVRDEQNGLQFAHEDPDAAGRLAGALARLVRDAALRSRLAAAAREDVRRYDYPAFAERLLEDFAELAHG